jgi:hypothetical protein
MATTLCSTTNLLCPLSKPIAFQAKFHPTTQILHLTKSADQPISVSEPISTAKGHRLKGDRISTSVTVPSSEYTFKLK